MKQAATVGGGDLVVAGAEAGEVELFVVAAAEALGRRRLLKPRMHRVRPFTPWWSCSRPLLLHALIRCTVRRPSVVGIARG